MLQMTLCPWRAVVGVVVEVGGSGVGVLAVVCWTGGIRVGWRVRRKAVFPMTNLANGLTRKSKEW